MYILVVARGCPSKQYPMNGIFEYDQAKALAEEGHKVFFAAIDLRSIRRHRKYGFHEEEVDGVHICSISIPLGAMGTPILQAASTLALRTLYKKIEKRYGRPDIVHAHFLGSGVVAAKLCKEESLPLVITEHTSCMNCKKWSKSVLVRASIAYAQADALIAVSKEFCENIKEASGYDSVCVHNIVDIDSFSAILKKHDQNESFNFVSVGNLIERKGFDLLLNAFSAAAEKHPNSGLTIIGGGPELSKLKALSERLGIADKVRFSGLLPRTDIAAEFARSDAFVLASRQETFGVVYIEAMAAGLPVVATRCGGPEDFVTDEVGVLIPTDNVSALTEAMEYMTAHIEQYNGSTISQYATDHFSPKCIASQLTDIYVKVLEDKFQ